jgi:hypothetical protein
MSLRRSAPRLVMGATALTMAGLWWFFAGSKSSGQDNRPPAPPYDCPAHAHTIVWPEQNPVWTVCWTQPIETQKEVSGSGIRLSHVYYKGKKVLERASLPLLNVKYMPDGACDAKPYCCGNDLANNVHTYTYRDWLTQYAPFKANNVLIKPVVDAAKPNDTKTKVAGYAEPTEPVQTLCDVHPNPGIDVGDFYGVAIEKRADEMIMTTALESGWYRYTQKWIFKLDGTLMARVAFTAVDNACTSRPHHHNAYWRLDFDLGDGDNNAIEEVADGPDGGVVVNRLATEATRNNLVEKHRKWRVIDKTTGTGYEVLPGPEDGEADDFGVADMWALHYKGPKEYDDGGRRHGQIDGNRCHLNDYVDGEKIDGEDVVLWYHSSHMHHGGLSANCEAMLIGCTLKPIGNW